MNLVSALFKTSIGRKILMAVTGLILIGFVTGHMIGNFHVFGPPEELNGYAHFLQSLGPALWIVRLALLAAVGLHIWAGVVLTLENRQARPQEYAFKNTIQATLASRAMRVTGVILLAFILYHLAHFTVGVGGDFTQEGTFKGNLPEYQMQHDFHLLGFLLVKEGTMVHDVFSMVVLGFQNPIVSGFYILAVGLLSFHLWHGAESMFQTLGLRTKRWAPALSILTKAYCLAYFLGNLAIVGSILAGVVEPHAIATASAHAAIPHP
jgi:succinate dehydrogenase / fumarate reductase cytochrome b subunit